MKQFFLTHFIIGSVLIAWAQPEPTQNVGIGTASPTRAKLELHGAVGSTTAIFGGESSGISLQRNGPGIGFNTYFNSGFKYMSAGYAAVQYLNPNNGYMMLDMLGPGNANSPAISIKRAFTIANNGNMGMGTDPGNTTLYIKRGTNFDGSAVFGGSQYNSHFHYGLNEDTYIRAGINGGRVIINDVNAGKIAMGSGLSRLIINNINGTYPTYSTLEIVQVNGKGLLLVEPNNSFNNWGISAEALSAGNPSSLTLKYNGQVKGYFSYNTGNYTTVSDMRLKTDIEELPPLLQKIMQLKPVDYEMKYHNPNQEKTVGFIAQDVKQLFPELVTITTDTSRGYSGINDLHGINYNGFTVLTFKAIQEQQELIKKMQQMNAVLARRIELAEAIVNAKK